MVIAVLQHGLGNQLFQYAAGRAASDRLKTSLWLDPTHFSYVTSRALDLSQFRLRARLLPGVLGQWLTPRSGTSAFKRMAKALIGRGIRTYTDAEQGYDPRYLGLGRFCRLDGFWQSEQYFMHLRTQLLAELEPRNELPAPLESFSRRVAQEESIAVHVRRGDLIANGRYAETVGALHINYYQQALERLQVRMPHARVYLFSDDPAWCAAKFPRVFATEIVSGNVTRSAIEDLAVMKRCRHFVIANSTFSWWAAWLGTHPSKQVIAPSQFFRVPRTWEKDLLPSEWERIVPTFEELR